METTHISIPDIYGASPITDRILIASIRAPRPCIN